MNLDSPHPETIEHKILPPHRVLLLLLLFDSDSVPVLDAHQTSVEQAAPPQLALLLLRGLQEGREQGDPSLVRFHGTGSNR